jgi:hypothetical protein
VEVENPSDKPVAGGGVKLVVGGGAGQLPLAGSTAKSLRVVNADGLEYLYRIEAASGEKDVLSAGDAVLFAVDVPAKQTATYFVYADNTGADAVCMVGKSWDYQAREALGIDLDENIAMIEDSVRLARARVGYYYLPRGQGQRVIDWKEKRLIEAALIKGKITKGISRTGRRKGLDLRRENALKALEYHIRKLMK